MYNINSNKNVINLYMLNVKINKINLEMDLDSGSSVSGISKNLWDLIYGNKFKMKQITMK